MYTDMPHTEVNTSIREMLDLIKLSFDHECSDGSRYSLRRLNTVVCPRLKGKLAECRFGRAYSTEFVEVTFSDIMNVCKYSDDNSYMYVGNQLRKYHLGVPMGDPLSVAKANSLCMAHELKADLTRETLHGDSVRNLSLCFMDDLYYRVAYVDAPDSTWTERSARNMIDELKLCYPRTLVLE